MDTGRTLLAALLTLGLAAVGQAQEMRIQYAEPVALTATPGTTYFEAYGRRFDIVLERNDRLFKALPRARKAELDRARPLRGKLEGVARSWVRLARVGTGIEGAIWDGQDLYVVTTLAEIASNLTTPVSGSPGQVVVYRLSDTLGGLPEAFCGLVEGRETARRSRVTGLEKYQALVAQLSAASPPEEQLDIALIADTAFQQQSGALAHDLMVARLNIVDGIFVEQVGVYLSPTEFRLVPANDDPFTATDAGQLLAQLATHREQTPTLRTAGIAHLMTGKDLDGTTIGVAYIDALCEPHFGVSLSSTYSGNFISALVMAHELGHNFGAEHDGVPGGSCESTGYGHIMWPSVISSSTFSQCSKTAMSQAIARARGNCIGPASYADVSAQAAGYIDTDANAEFTVPITIRSLGNLPALDVTLDLTLHPALDYRGANLLDGSCTAAGNTVSCALGDLAPGEERVVGIRLFSSQLTGVTLASVVHADNDLLSGNDTTQTSIGFRSAIDLAVAMEITPASAYANDPIDIALDVSSLRTQAAVGGRLTVTTSSLVIDSITAGDHACTSTTIEVRCDLADVPSGETSRIVVRVHGVVARTYFISANVQVVGDGDSSNNFANGQFELIREREVNIIASPDSMSFETGTLQEVTYTVTAAGRLPIDAVEFRGIAPWNGEIDSLVPSSGSCPTPGGSPTSCQLGPMNPGDVRTVTMRFRTTSNGTSAALGQVLFYLDPHTVFDRTAHTQLYSNLLIDAVAREIPYGAIEDMPSLGFVGVESVGIQPAQNVVATLELPEPLELAAVEVTHVTGWTCVLQTTRRAQCTGSFTARGGATIKYSYTPGVTGDFFAKFSITADGDLNADNDTIFPRLEIQPYQDVGVSTTLTHLDLVAGQNSVAEFVLTTGHRVVPNVYVQATGSYGHRIVSMTAPGGSCSLFGDVGRCAFPDLGPNASVLVTITYTTFVDDQHGNVVVRAFAGQDYNPSNDNVTIPFDTVALSDLKLETAQSAATAVNGFALRFPLITVTNGTYAARNVIVRISLPTFVTIQSVSASALCSGTNPLVCEFDMVPSGSTRTLDLTLATTATGSFTSDVSLESANDATSADNQLSVQLSVTAPPAPPSPPANPPSSSGGGGGGRVDWLAALLLGLILVSRAVRYQISGRYDGMPVGAG